MDDTTPRGTLVLLIRHGLTPTTGRVLPGRAPGLHLSDAGAAQASGLVERLAGLPLAAVRSSPLERARETAAPTASDRGLEVGLEDALLECDVGDWTGADLSAVAALPEWQEVQRRPSGFVFPGGEGFAAMQRRVVDAIERLRVDHEGGTVACFSHADPIKAALVHYLGSPLDAIQRVWVAPASVSAVWFAADDAPAVVTVNSTAGSLAGLGQDA